MTKDVKELIREYVEDEIPTTPGGSAMIECCANIGCPTCAGWGWKAVRRLTPQPMPAISAPKKDHRRED